MLSQKFCCYYLVLAKFLFFPPFFPSFLSFFLSFLSFFLSFFFFSLSVFFCNVFGKFCAKYCEKLTSSRTWKFVCVVRPGIFQTAARRCLWTLLKPHGSLPHKPSPISTTFILNTSYGSVGLPAIRRQLQPPEFIFEIKLTVLPLCIRDKTNPDVASPSLSSHEGLWTEIPCCREFWFMCRHKFLWTNNVAIPSLYLI